MTAKNQLRRESDPLQRQGGDPLPSNRTCYSMFLHLSIKTTCCFYFVDLFMFNINMNTGSKARFYNTACKMSTVKQGLTIEVTLCFTFYVLFSLTLYGLYALFCYLIYSEGDMIFDLDIFIKEFLDFLLEFFLSQRSSNSWKLVLHSTQRSQTLCYQRQCETTVSKFLSTLKGSARKKTAKAKFTSLWWYTYVKPTIIAVFIIIIIQ